MCWYIKYAPNWKEFFSHRCKGTAACLWRCPTCIERCPVSFSHKTKECVIGCFLFTWIKFLQSIALGGNTWSHIGVVKWALCNSVLSKWIYKLSERWTLEELINNHLWMACSHGARRRDGSAFLDRPTTTGPAPLALHCSSCSAHEKAAADASYDVAAAKGRWKQGPPFLI